MSIAAPFVCAAVLFDMDGVVTDTARAHAAAWKQLFDGFLRARAEAGGEPLVPFDQDRDYRAFVDGKPRYEGVASFLAARGIELPWGDPADPPGDSTICGLGNRKDRLFNDWLAAHPAPVFPTTVALVERLKGAGIKVAIFSASRNAEAVLKSAGLRELFDLKLDGADAAREGLAGKPDPAVLLAAAERLGAPPERTAVVEDAQAGVEAGRRGGFGLVIGVDRDGSGQALRDKGADWVVHDLAALALDEEHGLKVKTVATLPSAWDREHEVAQRLRGRRPAVFLDYDGTLTPIVENPDEAIISEAARETVARLAGRFPVAVVSGRDVPLLRRLIRLDDIFYAGSHGFVLAGPGGFEDEQGTGFLPDLDAVEGEVEDALEGIAGAAVERKRFDVSVHYRQVAEADVARVEAALDEVLQRHPRLRRKGGKKVWQIQPRLDWNKGRAVLRVIERLGLDRDDVLPIFIGDDVTDEDAFVALHGNGLCLVVRGESERATAADLALADPDEVRRFLEMLIAIEAEGDA
jgi:trehalose 6-phosphate phosphatase